MKNYNPAGIPAEITYATTDFTENELHNLRNVKYKDLTGISTGSLEILQYPHKQFTLLILTINLPFLKLTQLLLSVSDNSTIVKKKLRTGHKFRGTSLNHELISWNRICEKQNTTRDHFFIFLLRLKVNWKINFFTTDAIRTLFTTLSTAKEQCALKVLLRFSCHLYTHKGFSIYNEEQKLNTCVTKNIYVLLHENRENAPVETHTPPQKPTAHQHSTTCNARRRRFSSQCFRHTDFNRSSVHRISAAKLQIWRIWLGSFNW